MVSRRSGGEQNCIQKVRHSKLKLADPGTARTAILLNHDKTQVRRIRVDGCLAPAGTVSADWVASKPKVVDVVVELKGRNVDHAVDQIEATWRFWRGHVEHDDDQDIGAWILCSEYPRASTKVARYRESFRARGSILIISTHNGEQRPFSDFVPAHS
jgi:hypothetical protein